MPSNQEVQAFKTDLQKKIEQSTHQKIMQALLEILSSHDIIIAGSLDMDVNQIVYDAAVSELNTTIKE